MTTIYSLVVGNDTSTDSSDKLENIVNKLNVNPVDPSPGDPPPEPNTQFYWLIDVLFKLNKYVEQLETRIEHLEH